MERSCVLNAETLSAFTADWGSVFHCGTVATVAVLRSENTSDKKSIVHTLSLKEGLLWGIYKKKGLSLYLLGA